MQVVRDAEWRKSPDRDPEMMRWLYGFDARARSGIRLSRTFTPTKKEHPGSATSTRQSS
jgi:hypothetical protein